MIPFEESYYKNKLKKFTDKCKIKQNIVIDNVKLEYESIISDKITAYMHNYIGDVYRYPKLIINNELTMKVSALKIGGCYEASKNSKGKVCVVGLGLGYFVQEILPSDEVREIIVFEIDKNVIDLYKMNFGENKKIKILNEDAFIYAENHKGENFDFFFCDMYNYKISKNNIEDYKFFRDKFNITEYTFLGVEKLILSAKLQNIKNCNIPEFWVNLSNNLEDRSHESKYKENIITLNL